MLYRPAGLPLLPPQPLECDHRLFVGKPVAASWSEGDSVSLQEVFLEGLHAGRCYCHALQERIDGVFLHEKAPELLAGKTEDRHVLDAVLPDLVLEDELGTRGGLLFVPLQEVLPVLCQTYQLDSRIINT